MAYGVSNGHMTDDLGEVLIVTSVCLGADRLSRKKVTALDRLRVRTNIILFDKFLLTSNVNCIYLSLSLST